MKIFYLEQPPKQKIFPIPLLEDLWQANSLIVDADPCQYSIIWESLSEDEQSEVKKLGKIKINVCKPLSEVLQEIHSLIGVETEPVEGQSKFVSEIEQIPLEIPERQLELLQVDDFHEAAAPTTNEDVSTVALENAEIEVITSSSLSHVLQRN